MLPRVAAADLKSQDILVLTQPGNPIGQKNKGLELGVLFNSDLFKLLGVYNSVIKSNILEYSGALASTSSNQYTEVCHLDVDPRMDVEFHVWGTSNLAEPGEGGTSYQYGLRGKAEQYYEGEDIGNVLEAMSPSYHQDEDGDISTPSYNAVFGLKPYEFYFIQAKPTKRVTLYLSTGTSFSPYQATRPSSFSLKIQATIFPSKYVNNILKATTP
jgi:hypothetical protein